MEDDGDFTFPTSVVATPTAVPKGRGDVTAAPPAAGMPGSAAPRLWPFAAPPIAAATVKEEEEDGEAPTASTRKKKEEEDVGDEDRMDMLWDDTAAAAKKSPAAAARTRADERAAELDSMDQLWESFNEEPLLLLRRARPKQHGVAVAPGALPAEPPDRWYHPCTSSTSDAESEEAPRYGCAPTMLRASSRAAAAGRFCGSPRRGAAGGWALLLRLFRRLFAVDRAAPRRHGIRHVP